MHTTGYTNTFIAVADDCPVDRAEVPVSKAGEPSVAERQFTLLHDRPYALTSDDVLFTVHAERQGIPESERKAARAAFFSKGQPCMRASPLTKRYGFGVHSDALQAGLMRAPERSGSFAACVSWWWRTNRRWPPS